MSSEPVILSALVNFILTLLVYSLALHHYFLIQCVPKAFLVFFITIGFYWLLELLPIRIGDDVTVVVFGSLTCLCVLLGRWLGSAWLTAMWAGSSILGLFCLLVACAMIAQPKYWMGSVDWVYFKLDNFRTNRKAKKEKKALLKEKEAEMSYNRSVDI